MPGLRPLVPTRLPALIGTLQLPFLPLFSPPPTLLATQVCKKTGAEAKARELAKMAAFKAELDAQIEDNQVGARHCVGRVGWPGQELEQASRALVGAHASALAQDQRSSAKPTPQRQASFE